MLNNGGSQDILIPLEQVRKPNQNGKTIQMEHIEWEAHPTFSKVVNLIIKATNRCNFECKYCFIEPEVFHMQMSYETLERVIQAFLTANCFEVVHFIWHGGEPLLRGLKFYKEVINLQRHYDTGKVGYLNSIQTNASRLTDEVLDFFFKNNFRVGLSLDGPEEINDSVRLVRGAGKHNISAYRTVEEAVRRMREHKMPVGAIVVLSRANLNYAASIYRTFKEQKIHMKINPLMKSGFAVPNYDDLSITPEDYARFMIEMFDLWFYDPHPTIGINPFDNHIARLLNLPGAIHECRFSQSCHKSFLGISPNGDLFPCGLFQGMPAFKYGNIHDMNPEAILQSPLWHAINHREKQVLETCKKCDFRTLCYSGCPYHSVKNAGYYYQKDYYCEGYKSVFEHITRAVHADLRRAMSISGNL